MSNSEESTKERQSSTTSTEGGKEVSKSQQEEMQEEIEKINQRLEGKRVVIETGGFSEEEKKEAREQQKELLKEKEILELRISIEEQNSTIENLVKKIENYEKQTSEKDEETRLLKEEIKRLKGMLELLGSKGMAENWDEAVNIVIRQEEIIKKMTEKIKKLEEAEKEKKEKEGTTEDAETIKSLRGQLIQERKEKEELQGIVTEQQKTIEGLENQLIQERKEKEELQGIVTKQQEIIKELQEKGQTESGTGAGEGTESDGESKPEPGTGQEEEKKQKETLCEIPYNNPDRCCQLGLKLGDYAQRLESVKRKAKEGETSPLFLLYEFICQKAILEEVIKRGKITSKDVELLKEATIKELNLKEDDKERFQNDFSTQFGRMLEIVDDRCKGIRLPDIIEKENIEEKEGEEILIKRPDDSDTIRRLGLKLKEYTQRLGGAEEFDISHFDPLCKKIVLEKVLTSGQITSKDRELLLDDIINKIDPENRADREDLRNYISENEFKNAIDIVIKSYCEGIEKENVFYGTGLPEIVTSAELKEQERISRTESPETEPRKEPGEETRDLKDFLESQKGKEFIQNLSELQEERLFEEFKKIEEGPNIRDEGKEWMIRDLVRSKIEEILAKGGVSLEKFREERYIIEDLFIQRYKVKKGKEELNQIGEKIEKNIENIKKKTEEKEDEIRRIVSSAEEEIKGNYNNIFISSEEKEEKMKAIEEKYKKEISALVDTGGRITKMFKSLKRSIGIEGDKEKIAKTLFEEIKEKVEKEEQLNEAEREIKRIEEKSIKGLAGMLGFDANNENAMKLVKDVSLGKNINEEAFEKATEKMSPEEKKNAKENLKKCGDAVKAIGLGGGLLIGGIGGGILAAIIIMLKDFFKGRK